MKRRSPTWLYIFVLAGVFVLSVAAPLAWNRTRPPEVPAAAAPAEPPAAPVASVAAVAIPESPILEPPPEAVIADDLPPRLAALVPEHNDPAPPVGDLVLPGPELSAAPLLRHPLMAQTGAEKSRPSHGAESTADISARLTAGWLPSPDLLLAQLDGLKSDSACSAWAASVHRKIAELTQCQAGDLAKLRQLLRELRQSVDSADKLSLTLEPESRQIELRRVAYALSRRIDLWEAATEMASPGPVGQAEARGAGRDSLAMATPDRRSRGGVTTESDESPRFGRRLGGWLSLRQNEAKHQNDAKHRDRPRKPATGAEPTLSQERDEVARLLEDVERYEQHALGADAQTLSASIQALAAEDSPAARQLARQLEAHYRNANFRAAISADLLDRLLPQPNAVENEVNDEIHGARVYGQNTVFTTLGIRLVPSANDFRLMIVADGVVDSQTAAHSGPAVFQNEGQTSFHVYRPINITRQGIERGEVEADADAHSNVVGISTDYDHVPFLSPIVRHIAGNKERQQHAEALREVEDKVAAEARERFSKQLDPRIDQGLARFQKKIWQPLESLKLNPTPLEMYTTDKRLVTRVRMASREQLGAHTPRPRAPSDSLASMQINESMLNNIIEHLHLDGQDLTLPQLYKRLAHDLKRDAAEVPDTLPGNVHIRFADQDAVRVRCTEGRVELQLTLAEVRKGQERWENLVVRGYYEPEGTGLDARLVRSAPIELTGERLTAGSQIALRGAFSKLLSKSRSVALVPAKLSEDKRLNDLEVTQFQISDGWISVAIGPRNSGEHRATDNPTAKLPRWRLANLADQEVRRP